MEVMFQSYEFQSIMIWSVVLSSVGFEVYNFESAMILEKGYIKIWIV